MFVFGDEYTRLVREFVSAPRPVDVAVAFLGADAERLLSNSTGGRVICNLESGATNPAVVKTLLENRSFEVRTLSSLHAKVILSGGRVLTGSANISANGLGLESAEAARWYEAGIFSEDPTVVETAGAWFRDLWQKAVSIGVEDLLAAEMRWKARRSTRPSGASPRSDTGLFAHILSNPEFVLDRPIHLAVYREHASVEADNAFLRWKKSEGVAEDGALEFYEGWPELPNNAYLVDIHCGPKGGISSGGFYWTGPEKITKEFNYRGAGKGELRIVFKQSTYDGMQIKRKELDRFLGLVAPVVRAMCFENSAADEETAFCVPLGSIIASVEGHGVPAEA
ncbi:phospholipase D family protein [Desulfonatronospira sp.]|uniref:phospholipase D family protein n=1 Tax=Desulfonatronospira sp. TaxID=1962951 RepID=UPI0025B99163|nr:phospholipase D family protein [Desulfonatronospira sp.]